MRIKYRIYCYCIGDNISLHNLLSEQMWILSIQDGAYTIFNLLQISKFGVNIHEQDQNRMCILTIVKMVPNNYADSIA